MSAIKDPIAMPMMVPTDSCVGLEGSSRFGDRSARSDELAGELAELVAVADEPCARIPMVKWDGVVA